MLSVTVPGKYQRKGDKMKTLASCENCRWLRIEDSKAYCRQLKRDMECGLDFICDFYCKGSKALHGWKREEMERIKRSL